MERIIRIPLLAVDGGGTKSQVVLMDKAGSLLGQGRGGSCNYQGVGRDAAIRELSNGIHEAVRDWAKRQSAEYAEAALSLEIECAVFALAGLDTTYDRNIIMDIVNEALVQQSVQVKRLIVENDGLSALLGAASGTPGILVIAGTGSIVYGINGSGDSARSGGWGHRTGDEGSGYWIGKQAVTAMLRAHDGRGRATRLEEWIFPHMGVSHPEQLFNWIYGNDYSVEKLSDLSKFVSLAAAAGDSEAHRILTAASDELFIAVKAVIDRLQLRDIPFKLMLQGGVLQNDTVIRHLLTQQIRAYADKSQLETLHNEPIFGITAMGLSYLNAGLEQ
ncbi:N-acetylglucosamine kinase [Paenibacillus rigui]|uniref:N-acetylglucosamine kinase n=1 Tax=Paenibacillus rigui TaxID=554312 RepID=A0A229UQV7_9BACL|nr:BadF/BadG/BcrA/BcrD ATPase family protein [Paenibacillus rigui]OXM85967.1 N-acetylglucosamine kinase [Paenibacillus rigui]